MQTWPLQEAKAKFSAVIRAADQEGVQRISVRGQKHYVLLPEAEYRRLLQPKPGFLEFMAQSPLYGMPLDLERDRSLPRDVTL
jgi:antitoxin Phd